MATGTFPSNQERATSAPQVQQGGVRQTSLIAARVELIGRELARYALAAVILWIGFMKFTAYEAEGISPFAANSPLMSWAHALAGARAFSAVLGLVEIAVAVLIALRRPWPWASAVGSALAVGMFLTTLSFLITTPGVWEPSAGGFPALSALPGQFLVKDLALLGISLWTLGESLLAAQCCQ
jgi:reactive chlorine resistance protein C